MTDERILIVCAANVCRSPLAELALRRGLGGGSPIVVSSAGVRANPGDPICSTVAAVHDDPAWRDDAAAHRARLVTAEMIEQASLVLTASKDIRGELVRLSPRSRDRMFTLKETAHLGAGFSSSAADRVVEYVAHLDRARSRAVPLSAPADLGSRVRRLLAGRGAADPASIADRHASRGHRETVHEVSAAVATIAAQLNGSRRQGS